MNQRIIYFAMALLIGAIACSKTDNVTPSQAHMRFINVTPNGSFDVYSNGEKLLGGLTFDSVSNFASGLPGLYDLSIRNTGSSTDLIQGHQQLQSGTYYSMFMVPDTTGKTISSDKITISTITENTTTPARDSIRIRFLNLAPYTNPITIVMTINGRTRTTDTLRPFAQRYFNDQVANSSLTNYYYTFAADWKIHFYDTKDSVYIIDTPHLNLSSQGIYTLYLKGTPGGTGDQKLSYRLLKQQL